jgi:predicted PurR-regulated permease PerM
VTNAIFTDTPLASNSTDNGTSSNNNLTKANVVVESGVAMDASMLPTIQWTARRIALATLTALSVVFIFLLLYRFYTIVFIFFVAFTLQIALRPAVAWLQRRGIRQDIALILVFTLLLVIVGGSIWLAAPLLSGQVSAILQQLPKYYQNLRSYLLSSSSQLLHTLASFLPAQFSLSSVTPTADAAVADPITPAWQLVKTFSYSIFVTIGVLMLAFYWTVEGELITRRSLLLAPIDQRDELRDLLNEMETKIGAYFRGEAILCAIVGVLSAIAFFIIGVPYALGLGIVMGLFEAIPTFGPSLAAVPVILLTLTTDPTKAIWALGAIAIIQFMESHFIVPRVMDRSVGVNAVVTLLAIASFGVLFGVGGAILAIPLAAILQIFFNRLVLNQPVTEEAAPPVVVAQNLERNSASVLRLETQALVQDVRKEVRMDDEVTVDPNAERAEDLIEAIAVDLDSLLKKIEDAVASPMNSSVTSQPLPKSKELA